MLVGAGANTAELALVVLVSPAALLGPDPTVLEVAAAAAAWDEAKAEDVDIAALRGPFDGFFVPAVVVEEAPLTTFPEFPATAEPDGTRCGPPPGTETWVEGARFEVTLGMAGAVGAGVDFDDEGG